MKKKEVPLYHGTIWYYFEVISTIVYYPGSDWNAPSALLQRQL
jgi:hypothetical protein